MTLPYDTTIGITIYPKGLFQEQFRIAFRIIFLIFLNALLCIENRSFNLNKIDNCPNYILHLIRSFYSGRLLKENDALRVSRDTGEANRVN